MLSAFKKTKFWGLIEPIYHFSLTMIGAIRYAFPSKKITVIGITGTKGKTSTAEFMDHILMAAGKKTAVLGTLHFKVGDKDIPNLRKMTMPGRFFVQKFLRDAVDAGCTHAVIEMTSEGARQYRQRFIDMDALIFTNLAPEHIERHGSFENYREAKLDIARTLARSMKAHNYLVINKDDENAKYFAAIPHTEIVEYSRNQLHQLVADDSHFSFIWNGTHVKIEGTLPGEFNAMNALAAATCAKSLGVPSEAIMRGVKETTLIRGRAEKVNAGQPFDVVVDYAHTPDSLEALYKTFANKKIIAVLGSTGGGRDTWKRPEMGKMADNYAEHIILANEDPYDEDPMEIINQVKAGITNKNSEIIFDRREAIARAIAIAKETPNSAVLLTGKGTDPFIMGPDGSKEKWDEATVAREEIKKLGY